MAELGYLIAGNWKMNGLSGDAKALAAAVAAGAGAAPAGVDLLICPPAAHLARPNRRIPTAVIQQASAAA